MCPQPPSPGGRAATHYVLSSTSHAPAAAVSAAARRTSAAGSVTPVGLQGLTRTTFLGGRVSADEGGDSVAW
jgi:hypothetical protein